MVGSRGVAARVETIVQLSDELVALLDERAAGRRISRSQLIRELLEQSLGADRRDAATRRLIEGYQRQPQSEGGDAWGDLNEWTAANAQRNLAALGDEEDERW